MEKLQYDSFYKFLVSLGAVLIATPMLGFYYLLTGNYFAVTSIDNFNNLTCVSQNIVLKQQEVLKVVVEFMPPVLGSLIVIGFFCILYGAIKWRSIQIELDEQTRLDTKIKYANYTQLSPTEILEKAVKELDEDKSEIEAAIPTPFYYKNGESIRKYLDIERRFFNEIVKQLSNCYDVKQNVRIGSYELDIIAISRQDSFDLIYEIKYYKTSDNANSLRQALAALSKSGAMYEQTSHRHVRMFLIVVCPKEFMEKNKLSCMTIRESENFQHINVEVHSEDSLKK